MGFVPPTNLTGQGFDTDLAAQKKISLLEPGPKQCFLLFYNVNCAGSPPRPGPGPSPARKIRLDLPSGTVMGGIFRPKITGLFFGPSHNMLRYSGV